MAYPTTTMGHALLQEKYFYRVDGLQGVYVGTNHMIPRNKTPKQLIQDQETCVVYLVDAQGRLFMQPAEMFPKEILNAPLWKTIPLPNVDFHRLLTPPSTPPSSQSAMQSHAHQRGYAAGLATYTGHESPQWAESRFRRDSQTYSAAPSPRGAYIQPTHNGAYYVYPQPVISQPAAYQPSPTKHVRFQ